MVQEHVLPQIPSIQTKPAVRILVVALALGWSAYLLFYDKNLGISLLLFVLLLLLALFGLGWWEDVRAKTHNLWLLLPLLFFASMAFIRANPFVTGLNVLGTLAILSYVVFFYGNGRVSSLGLVDIFWLPARVGGHSLSQTKPLLDEAVDMERVREHGRKNLFPVLRGLVLAVPVLLVFTALLTSADLIFADHVQNVLQLDFLPDVIEGIWRVCLIGVLAWVVAGGLAYAQNRQTSDDDQSLLDKAWTAIPRHISLGLTETATVLVLVDLLFAAFTAVQFTYLFDGRANITLEGYTYAEYARRGFFELLAVAMLSLVMIVGLNWITRRESKQQIRLFNSLSTPLIGFVLVMLVSAFYRMGLYETTYGYTELRLYVYVFMVWLGGLLAWFLLTLWQRPELFPVGIILTCVGFLATLNLLNPDAFIVRQNLAHYQATGKLDATYLVSLSNDAVPGLMAVLAQVKSDDQEMLVPSCAYNTAGERVVSRVEGDDELCYGTASEIIEEELNGRLLAMQENTKWQQWQAFHLSHWQAYRLLVNSTQ